MTKLRSGAPHTLAGGVRDGFRGARGVAAAAQVYHEAVRGVQHCSIEHAQLVLVRRRRLTWQAAILALPGRMVRYRCIYMKTVSFCLHVGGIGRTMGSSVAPGSFHVMLSLLHLSYRHEGST